MHFTHRAAHGDTTDKVVNVKSEQLLDELEVWYPQVFKEPTIPSLKIVFHLQFHWWIVRYPHQSVNCTP